MMMESLFWTKNANSNFYINKMKDTAVFTLHGKMGHMIKIENLLKGVDALC